MRLRAAGRGSKREASGFFPFSSPRGNNDEKRQTRTEKPGRPNARKPLKGLKMRGIGPASFITGAKQKVKTRTFQRSSGRPEARERDEKGKKPTDSLVCPAAFNRPPRFGRFFARRWGKSPSNETIH